MTNDLLAMVCGNLVQIPVHVYARANKEMHDRRNRLNAEVRAG